MKTFKEIRKRLEELPAFPKLYLLGSTGAGKTSIVRSILDTIDESFPSVSQSRTTIATTEYIISEKLPYKATFIFKDKDEILTSVNEVLLSAIDKAVSNKNSEDIMDEVVLEVEESSDERFRLKYLLESELIDEIAHYIINMIVNINVENSNIEDLLSLQSVQAEIKYLTDKIIQVIIDKVNKVCKNYTLFNDDLYTIESIDDKVEFITKIKELLKNDLDSISPLIEHARIEGNLLAKWLPKATNFILIDGEGMGHDLKENKHSLSTRHLDYFNYCDSILLVEKSDDPFITGGQSAIETIFLNGYSKKFKLLFSKVDMINAKDPKRVLTNRLRNVKSALEDNKIYFDVKKDKRYYLTSLDKKTNDETQKEIIRLLKNITKEFKEEESQAIELEYDFNSLFINFNTKDYLKRWAELLENEHWTIIKALNKRVLNSNAEYRYLKPILEFHTIIMKEINEFLVLEDDVGSEAINSQNIIKSKFSQKILKEVENSFIEQYNSQWKEAYSLKGHGSTSERKLQIQKIFNSSIPYEKEDIDIFKAKVKDLLLKSGASESLSATKIILKNIDIRNINGNKNISWEVDKDINILIGKNGTGKSTILKIIDAYFNSKNDILNKYRDPDITITINKQYTKDKSKDYILKGNSKKYQDIEIVMIDTFDMECDNKHHISPLDKLLDELLKRFDNYQVNLKKQFDDKNKPIQEKIDEIMSSDGDNFEEAKKLYDSKKLLENEVYSALKVFEDILNSMLLDTNKSVNLNNKSISLTINTKNSEIEVKELSSGEKQILIIFLTILLKENKPYILLMDEPEISLHVQWQADFIDNIKKLNNSIQIILVTHNPLIMLNRKSNEIGVLEIDQEKVVKRAVGTKYIDISSTLLEYFDLQSLVGQDMQNIINEYHMLHDTEDTTDIQQDRISMIEKELENTVATNFIYDKKYLKFLRFLKQNKNINFNEQSKLTDEQTDELLKDFKDFFND